MSEFCCCGCSKPLPLGDSVVSFCAKVHTFDVIKDALSGPDVSYLYLCINCYHRYGTTVKLVLDKDAKQTDGA